MIVQLLEISGGHMVPFIELLTVVTAVSSLVAAGASTLCALVLVLRKK